MEMFTLILVNKSLKIKLSNQLECMSLFKLYTDCNENCDHDPLAYSEAKWGVLYSVGLWLLLRDLDQNLIEDIYINILIAVSHLTAI